MCATFRSVFWHMCYAQNMRAKIKIGGIHFLCYPLDPKTSVKTVEIDWDFRDQVQFKPVNRHKHFDGHLDSKIEAHVVSVLLRSCEQAHTRIGCTCPKSIG